MVFKDFILERLSEANIEIAKALCDNYVGMGMYNTPYLRRIIPDKRHSFYLVKKGPAYIGYFYCQRIIAGSVSCLPGLDYEQISSLCGRQEQIGVCRSIGIKSKYRGSGLSDALLLHFQDYFVKKYNISLILVPAWSQGGYVPAKELLLRRGFKYLGDLTTPWADNKELQCPYCKKERCVCNAVVYYSGGHCEKN